MWIEKPHTADRDSSSVAKSSCPNVLTLESTFDINILMPYIDLLITDYSSAMLDALYFKKQIVYYVPDYEYYIKDDRGFLVDYDSVCINEKVMAVEDLLDSIMSCINKQNYGSSEMNIRKQFWKHDNWTYDDIWKLIISKVT